MEMQKDWSIKFYSQDGNFGFLSNFYSSPFEQNGIKYQTNQHYFQSKKFQGRPLQLKIVQCKKPGDAFRMGRSLQEPRRNDWEQIKQKIMHQGLKLKFTQNQNLKKELMSTGQRKLIEHTEKDKYWGDGRGNGKNRLGILLMQLRDQFRKSRINE